MQTLEGMAVELRPGVFRPDWSVAKSSAAREALRGRAAARRGLIDQWLHALSPDDDRVWRAMLEDYATLGRPPSAGEIRDRTGLSEGAVSELLGRLEYRDLIGRGPDGGIRFAYPFTEASTGHRVTLGRQTLNALCAIDALGTGAMYGTDISVRSACALCGNAIHVTTQDTGRTLAKVSPAGAVVWYDFAYAGSAATSCCPTITFFCDDDHLRQWLNSQAPRQGMRLLMSEALEVGRAIFGPVLLRP